MKIALLGGTFWPPHNGQKILAHQILEFTDCQEVWYLPNYDQKYYGGITSQKKVASVDHRLEMLNFILFPGAKVSTIEIDNRLDGQTINLLPHLPEGNEYSFVIGSDHLPRFKEWNGWETLLKTMRFLVFPRIGYPAEGLLLPGMELVQSELLIETNISSTIIRERWRQGLSVDGLMPEGLISYIEKNNVFGEGEDRGVEFL